METMVGSARSRRDFLKGAGAAIAAGIAGCSGRARAQTRSETSETVTQADPPGPPITVGLWTLDWWEDPRQRWRIRKPATWPWVFDGVVSERWLFSPYTLPPRDDLVTHFYPHLYEPLEFPRHVYVGVRQAPTNSLDAILADYRNYLARTDSNYRAGLETITTGNVESGHPCIYHFCQRTVPERVPGTCLSVFTINQGVLYTVLIFQGTTGEPANPTSVQMAQDFLQAQIYIATSLTVW